MPPPPNALRCPRLPPSTHPNVLFAFHFVIIILPFPPSLHHHPMPTPPSFRFDSSTFPFLLPHSSPDIQKHAFASQKCPLQNMPMPNKYTKWYELHKKRAGYKKGVHWHYTKKKGIHKRESALLFMKQSKLILTITFLFCSFLLALSVEEEEEAKKGGGKGANEIGKSNGEKGWLNLRNILRVGTIIAAGIAAHSASSQHGLLGHNSHLPSSSSSQNNLAIRNGAGGIAGSPVLLPLQMPSSSGMMPFPSQARIGHNRRHSAPPAAPSSHEEAEIASHSDQQIAEDAARIGVPLHVAKETAEKYRAEEEMREYEKWEEECNCGGKNYEEGDYEDAKKEFEKFEDWVKEGQEMGKAEGKGGGKRQQWAPHQDDDGIGGGGGRGLEEEHKRVKRGRKRRPTYWGWSGMMRGGKGMFNWKNNRMYGGMGGYFKYWHKPTFGVNRHVWKRKKCNFFCLSRWI